MIDEAKPVLLCKLLSEELTKNGPCVQLWLKLEVSEVLSKSGLTSRNDRLDCIADGMRLGRVSLEPDLHPLGDKRHYKFKNEQIVIWDHFDEGEHDAWEERDIQKERAPVA